MEEQRSGISKWLLLALAGVLFFTFGLPKLQGKSDADKQPLAGLTDSTAPADTTRAAEQTCTVAGGRFTAEFSTRGGSMIHYVLSDRKYGREGKPIDVVTPDLRESRRPLRTDFRPATITDEAAAKPSENLVAKDDVAQQVGFDDFDWKLGAHDNQSCIFTYEDASTEITKRITTTSKPFELELSITVKNLAKEPKKHRLAVEESAWRTKGEVAGGFLKRQSEFLTEVVASTTTKSERFAPSDFEASDFKKKEFDDEKWRQTPGQARFAAVSSSYFAAVVIPVDAPKAPRVETQIEEHWDASRFKEKSQDPLYGHVYRARVTYPEVELKSGEASTYKLTTFNGPKEREALAVVGNDVSDVLNLGRFAVIGKALIWYLYRLEALTRSWGWAIVLLTITVRLCLFPLSLAQIKNTAQTRKLKPELDVINAKYKDDMTQRGVATQELFRKHGMSQFSPVAGCLPMLLQLPVWWALYSSLQTAVELYHTPFLWFVDLSAPDKFFIIPVILGGTSFLQQKLMPTQGDPQQQKMMMYMMPGVFTVMMLFLPSGLGVYMLTSSIVSIGQQFVVERYLRGRAASGGGGSGIVVRDSSDDGDKSAPELGKGKARVRG